MTVIGFDFGKSNVGVAKGSTESGLADPLETISAGPRLPQEIQRVIDSFQPHHLVVGVSEGASGRAAQRFAAALKRHTGLPVSLADEMGSTQEADRAVRHKPRSKRALASHAAAAAIILERWFQDVA
jgi:putative transcription antitermination factor YqgF